MDEEKNGKPYVGDATFGIWKTKINSAKFGEQKTARIRNQMKEEKAENFLRKLMKEKSRKNNRVANKSSQQIGNCQSAAIL